MAVISISRILLLLSCIWLLVLGQPRRVNYQLLGEEKPPVTEENGVARHKQNSLELASSVFDLNTTVITADFDITYSKKVNLHQQYLFVYSYNETNSVCIYLDLTEILFS